MTGLLQSIVSTAAEVYEPDNGTGLIGLLIIGLPSTIAATLSGWALVRQKRIEAGVQATNKQVVNGHADADPLRKDLDTKFAQLGSKIDGLDGLVRTQGRDIGGIREDVGMIRGEAREDRQNLAQLEGRIAKFVRREHPGAEPL